MRYIRTKDNVYETIGKEEPCRDGEIEVFCTGHNSVAKSWIVTQANTIEDLCDGYVIEHPINAFRFFYDKEEMLKCLFNTCMRLFKVHELKVFGCIKTDKGLIYIAKMNGEGELELL